MVTFEEYIGPNPNITYSRVFLNGVHVANKIVPYEGYVLDDTSDATIDEEGNPIPKLYYRSAQAPITHDLSVYVAVLEEPGMEIAGVTDKPVTE